MTIEGIKVVFQGIEKYAIKKDSLETVMLIISSSKDEKFFRVELRGYDSNENASLIWIREQVSEYKAKLDVEFLADGEGFRTSKPALSIPDVSEDFVNNEKLKYFKKLKTELEEKGLI